MNNSLTFSIALIFILILPVSAGPLGYGICQSGCNALVVACYEAGGLAIFLLLKGLVFGSVTFGAGVPAAIVGCSAAQGKGLLIFYTKRCLHGCLYRSWVRANTLAYDRYVFVVSEYVFILLLLDHSRDLYYPP
jgi:hypothetical protein